MTTQEMQAGGATVRLTDTPSEQIVRAAAPVDVQDSTGRTITLKKPGVLAQFHFIEALGPLATNQVYVGMTAPLIYVSAIDGAPVALPSTKGEIEALIKRLDEAGLEVVMKAVQEHFGASTEGNGSGSVA